MSASDYQCISMEPRGSIALVTLNRPNAANALNGAMVQELAQVTAAVAGDEQPQPLGVGHYAHAVFQHQHRLLCRYRSLHRFQRQRLQWLVCRA